MFAGFNLETTEDYSLYYGIGEKLFESQKQEVEKDLNKFLGPNGKIDGTKIAENWFPEIEADIFISHSHKDEKQAIGLAGWLWDKFKIRAFIDSGVWGYAGDLLKEIDNKYCWDTDRKIYIYETRNFSTAHVHMMLNVALCRMIDKVECVLFLNTPNSITASEAVDNTNSSWIYSELVMTEIVRKKKLKEYRKGQTILMEQKSFSNQLEIDYNVQLAHLKPLSSYELRKWEGSMPDQLFIHEITNKSNMYALDKLYTISGIL